MMGHLIPTVLHFCLLASLWPSETRGFQWIDNVTSEVTGCSGKPVLFDWNYEYDKNTDNILNTEWFSEENGERQKLVMTRPADFAFGSLAVPEHNAVLKLKSATLNDTGTYGVMITYMNGSGPVTSTRSVQLTVSETPETTDGQLHAKMLPDAVYNSSTQQYHIQLSCGQFRRNKLLSVFWKTPSGQTLTSTSNENGRFLLSVPNPVTSGAYTCLIDDTSPASSCVQSGSPLQRGATVSVDGTEARFAVMEARMSALQAENVNLKQELQQEKQSNEDLRHDLQNLTRQMTQGDENLKQGLQTLTHQTAQEDDNLKHLISTNTQLMNSKSADLASKLQRAVHQVFFHVGLSSRTGTDNPIIFNGVHSNVGGGYSTSTGYFTAPVSGTYLFTVSILRSGGNSDDYTAVLLYMNGKQMGVVYAKSHATGSKHAVVHLSAGERAWIKGTISKIDIYDDRSTFSGVLIQADI